MYKKCLKKIIKMSSKREEKLWFKNYAQENTNKNQNVDI